MTGCGCRWFDSRRCDRYDADDTNVRFCRRWQLRSAAMSNARQTTGSFPRNSCRNCVEMVFNRHELARLVPYRGGNQ